MKKIKAWGIILCLLSFLIPSAYAEEPVANDKQSFAQPDATAFYNLLDKNNFFGCESGATATYGEEGIGKVLYAQSSDSQPYPPRLANYTSSTPAASARYFAFMYKYEGKSVNSTVGFTYTNGEKASGKVPLTGDNEWRVAVCDMTKGASDNSWTKLKFIVHTYTNKFYSTPFAFANYNIFLRNPEINYADLGITPAIGDEAVSEAENGAGYSVNSIEWTDEDNEPFFGSFEKGHIYYARVSLTANENYFINCDSFKVEGASETAVESTDSYIYGNTVQLCCTFDMTELSLVSSDIADGAENVGVINTELSLEFNKELVADETAVKNAITVSPDTDFHILFDGDKIIKLIFDSVLALGEEYYIQLSGGIKSVSGNELEETTLHFTTAENYPTPELVSSTLTDGEKDVSVNNPISFTYDMLLDQSSVDRSAITVEPSAEYEVYPFENGFELVLASPLEYNKTYTLSVSNSIKSIYATPIDAFDISFTTVKPLENLIKNGYFEDNTDNSMFFDDNGNTSLKYVTENGKNTLKFSPAWANAPVVYYHDFILGHEYFSSLTFMSDTTQEVVLSFIYKEDGNDNQYHNAANITVSAGVWNTVYTSHKISDKMLEGKTTDMRMISRVKGSNLYISEWTLFDRASAMNGEGAVNSITPANGAAEVNPNDFKMEISFDKQINPQTLAGGIKLVPSAAFTLTPARDFMSCTLSAEKLANNTTYTLSGSSLKTLRGESVAPFSSTFSTYTVKKEPFSVVSATPGDAATDTDVNGLIMSVTFDDYIDIATVNKQTVYADNNIISEIKPDSENPKKIKIYFNNLEKGKTYCVTLKDGIKNTEGYPLNKKTLSFTTKTEQYLRQSFSNAKTADEMKTFLAANISDICLECDLYSYLDKKDSTVLASVYNALILADDESSFEELKNLIEMQLLKQTILCGDSTDIMFLISSGTAGITLKDVYRLYSDVLSNDMKIALCKKLSGKSFDNPKKAITDAILLETMKNSNGWEQVRSILIGGKECFNGDDIEKTLSSVDSLSNSHEVYNKLQGFDGESVHLLYTAITTAYNAAKNKSGSGSGGGGGGSASSGVTNRNFGIGKTEKTQPVTVHFTDVPQSHWAYDYIEKLFASGIISGMGDGSFGTERSVKREEFIKMLLLSFDIKPEKYECTFSDVSVDSWAYPYVATAAKNNITSGMGNGSFGIGAEITREDIAVLIYNLLGSDEAQMQTEEFSDIMQAASYAQKAILYLRSKSIVSGDEKGNFNPKSHASRAEAAAMLCRAKTLAGGKSDD